MRQKAFDLAQGIARATLILMVSTVAAVAEPPPPQQKKGGPAVSASPPQAGQQVPDTPKKRVRALKDLYAKLATASDEGEAQRNAALIERLWLIPASDTILVLMERASKASTDKQFDLALNLLGVAIEIAPDYAEAFNRRAYVHYLQNDVGRAMGDLRRAVALDPSHFKALDGLGQMMKEVGEKKGALAVYRRLLEVHPFWPGAEQTVSELEREVEGQGL